LNVQVAVVDTDADSRTLIRILRSPPERGFSAGILPESVLWQTYCELRRRGVDAEDSFLQSLKLLHRRRTIGASELATADEDREEHKLVDDPFLGELWKAYKKCICNQRTGPGAQLLRDIEVQVRKHH
jgi:hypothetical protein